MTHASSNLTSSFQRSLLLPEAIPKSGSLFFKTFLIIVRMDLFSPNLSLIVSNLEYIMWDLLLFLLPIFGLYLDPDLANISRIQTGWCTLHSHHCITFCKSTELSSIFPVENVHATVTLIFGFISSVQPQWETSGKLLWKTVWHTNIMAAKVSVDAISTSTTMEDLWSEILGRRTELEGYCR